MKLNKYKKYVSLNFIKIKLKNKILIKINKIKKNKFKLILS